MLFEGDVVSLGSEGEGVLRRDGCVVFVPGSIPGDRIRYQLTDTRGRFHRGALEQVLSPSPNRRPSPCALDVPSGCGGCDLLAMEPEAAAVEKAEQFRQRLRRALGDDDLPMAPPIRVGSGLAYRNHARFHVVGKGRLAYVGRPGPTRGSSRARVPVETCPVLHPSLDALLPALQHRVSGARVVEIRGAPTTGDRIVILHGPHIPNGFDPVALDASSLWRGPNGDVPLKGLPWIHEEIDGTRLRVSVDAFFQPNSEGAALLASLVRRLVPQLDARSWAVDLFAGVGLFSLCALRGAGRITAAEASPISAADFEENARGRAEVTLIRGDAAAYVSDLTQLKDHPDVIVADPPRAGLGLELAGLLARVGAPCVVLVSCRPDTLARDLPPLLAGGYRLKVVQPVDQFGGTHHLEAVAVLERPSTPV